MATLAELQQQIRFALSQLAARNAHHDFEHLCRSLARARICSNILPATGPVSAGGDQGRDFETFRSYLAASIADGSTFVGLLSDGPLAFACTIQKSGLNAKIRGDVASIVGHGSTVMGVHIFLSEDLPVAKRHDIQKWARENHSVSVDIYDGMAIAEFLTDPDLFHIAVEYLRLPSESYPEPRTQESWYSSLRTQWSTAVAPVPDLTYSNFYDLKRALRMATDEELFRPDLPRWIALLAHFESSDAVKDLQRRACYEISVAMLKGQGTMHGRGSRVAWYFGDLPTMSYTSDLEDATNLLSFCLGALVRHAVDLHESQLQAWQLELTSRLELLLAETPSPTARCFLLELRGHVGIFVTSQNKRAGKPNLDDAFRYWSQLPKAAKNAPLYPLERLSDRLTLLVTLFGDDPRLLPLADSVDALLAKRSGLIVAGGKIRDRAIEFHKRGQVVRAIEEVHRVKLSWFAHEALDGCCTALLILSEWYSELGLTFAAKYHALAAAFLGMHDPNESLRRFLPRGIIAAADRAYQQGCWLDFLDLAEFGMSSLTAVPTSRIGKSTHDSVERTMLHTALIHTLSERLDVKLLEVVRTRCKRWGLKDWLDEILPDIKEVWDKLDEAQLWEHFGELSGRPFSDVGPERAVEWKQLGIRWKVCWRNTYEITARAEQFIAVLQILLCKAAGRDLCLLEATVEIEFSVADVTSPKMIPLLGNDVRRWRVSWPLGIVLESNANAPGAMQEALTMAICMLHDISLLPDRQFYSAAKKLFQDGLSSAIHIAKSYEVLYRQIVRQESFSEIDRSKLQPPGMDRHFRTPESAELRPFDGPGPGYSKAKSERAASNRYARIPPLIRFTLRRLNADAEFTATVKQLRAEGWLDWHVLTAIANAAMNYRARAVAGGTPRPDTLRKVASTFYKSPEQEGLDPIPTTEFSIEKLKFALKTSLLSTVVNEGLSPRHQTPLLDAILDLMAKRYGYWTDDAPHCDFFAEKNSTVADLS